MKNMKLSCLKKWIYDQSCNVLSECQRSDICVHGWIYSVGPSDAYMRQLTNHHWFRQWIVACTAPSHYLNQCWNNVNWTIKNKFSGIFIKIDIFFQDSAFEYVVWKLAAILYRRQFVNHMNLPVMDNFTNPKYNTKERYAYIMRCIIYCD